MGKNNIEDIFNAIETDNSKFEVLFHRIDILNRVIKELENNNEYYLNVKNEICDSSGKDEEIERLKQQLDKKNEEIEDMEEKLKEIGTLKEKNNKLKDEKKELDDKIDSLQNKYDEMCTKYIKISEFRKEYEDVDRIYKSYCELDNSVKKMFEGFIFNKNIATFISSVATEQKLERFYKKINEFVVQHQDEIVNSQQFSHEQRVLAEVFDFYFQSLIIIDKNSEYNRFDVKVDDAYDDEFCSRIGDPFGDIKDVLLQGYSMDDKKVFSIVLVQE